jgi:hypothetical protein
MSYDSVSDTKRETIRARGFWREGTGISRTRNILH